MSKVYNNKITITAGFNYPAEKPIDDRFVVQVKSDLDDLVTNNVAYIGLIVYVTDEKSVYVYDGVTWNVMQGSGGISEDTLEPIITNMIEAGTFDSQLTTLIKSELLNGEW